MLAGSDVSAGHAEADRLSDLQIEGESRHAEWMSLMVRNGALMLEGDDAGLGAAMQLVIVGRSISRAVDDNSGVYEAMLLSLAGRFDEALPAAMQCLDSQVIGQTARMNLLVPAVRSLAGLGRYEDALETVEKDFGPMIDSQRKLLQAHQVVALIVILHQLQRLERIKDIAAVANALSHDHWWGDREARVYLADIIGGDDAFAALPTPDPAELTPDRVATLINGLITDIRHEITT
ncbi:MAG: hypothetical protein GXP35_05600 [Actinobacteria bacterium]|nr:hypothetical protein [Actinomycetota bacterium]